MGKHIRIMESEVPDHVIDAFEKAYRKIYDLETHSPQEEWGNTRRYKHDGVQQMWEGWRDCYLYVCKPAIRAAYPSARGT